MNKVFDADSLISKMPSTFHSTKKELLVVSEENLDSYGNFPFSGTAPSFWNNLPD